MLPSQGAVQTGKKLILTCYSMTKPQWFKDARIITDENVYTPWSDLIVYSSRSSDMGRYVCQGTNQLGNIFEAYADVYVAGKKNHTLTPLAT